MLKLLRRLFSPHTNTPRARDFLAWGVAVLPESGAAMPDNADPDCRACHGTGWCADYQERCYRNCSCTRR